MNQSYNQVIRDFAQMVSDLKAETIFAATRLHLLDTDTKLHNEIVLAEASPVFNIEEVLANPDPRIQRIMQTYLKAQKARQELEAYWLTTEEWSGGEEL
jgi:hypothetical protein